MSKAGDSIIKLMNHIEDLMDQGKIHEDVIDTGIWNSVTFDIECIRLEEREACAKIAENDVPEWAIYGPGKGIATAIRQRQE